MKLARIGPIFTILMLLSAARAEEPALRPQNWFENVALGTIQVLAEPNELTGRQLSDALGSVALYDRLSPGIRAAYAKSWNAYLESADSWLRVRNRAVNWNLPLADRLNAIEALTRFGAPLKPRKHDGNLAHAIRRIALDASLRDVQRLTGIRALRILDAATVESVADQLLADSRSSDILKTEALECLAQLPRLSPNVLAAIEHYAASGSAFSFSVKRARKLIADLRDPGSPFSRLPFLKLESLGVPEHLLSRVGSIHDQYLKLVSVRALSRDFLTWLVQAGRFFSLPKRELPTFIQHVERVLEVLVTDPNTRTQIVHGLLAAYRRDANTQSRVAILEFAATRDLRNQAIEAEAMRLLASPQAPLSLQVQAVAILARSNDPRAMHMLSQNLAHPSPELRRLIQHTLAQVQGLGGDIRLELDGELLERLAQRDLSALDKFMQAGDSSISLARLSRTSEALDRLTHLSATEERRILEFWVKQKQVPEAVVSKFIAYSTDIFAPEWMRVASQRWLETNFGKETERAWITNYKVFRLLAKPDAIQAQAQDQEQQAALRETQRFAAPLLRRVSLESLEGVSEELQLAALETVTSEGNWSPEIWDEALTYLERFGPRLKIEVLKKLVNQREWPAEASHAICELLEKEKASEVKTHALGALRSRTYLPEHTWKAISESLNDIEMQAHALRTIAAQAQFPDSLWPKITELLKSPQLEVRIAALEVLKSRPASPDAAWTAAAEMLFNSPARNNLLDHVLITTFKTRKTLPLAFQRKLPSLLSSATKQVRLRFFRACTGLTELPRAVWDLLPASVVAGGELGDAALALIRDQTQWTKGVWTLVLSYLNGSDVILQTVALQLLANQTQWPAEVWARVPSVMRNEKLVQARRTALIALRGQQVWPQEVWNELPARLSDSDPSVRQEALACVLSRTNNHSVQALRVDECERLLVQ